MALLELTVAALLLVGAELDITTAELLLIAVLELIATELELTAAELGLGVDPPPFPPPPHAANSELKVIRLKYCRADCFDINVLIDFCF
jgi:hypothetical protein